MLHGQDSRPTPHFNSRTREGCDPPHRAVAFDEAISTHAPVKGATIDKATEIAYSNISTHAPVKGATCRMPPPPHKPTISTHAPVKGATNRSCYGFEIKKISTHAPVKGATRHLVAYQRDPRDFNSRTREGCDPVPQTIQIPSDRYFNSRTREGCDGCGHGAEIYRNDFNSRTREGCDGYG